MIRSAIIDYGNLGRSVGEVIADQPDTKLVGVFSRHGSLNTETRVLSVADVGKYKNETDVLFVCLGSATDVPEQAPDLAENFTTVDTYDNHYEIPKHRVAMETAAREGNNIAMISTGWDPGLLSLSRVLGVTILPSAGRMAFWGPGLSQGHSDTVRRVPGVKEGVQYIKPNPEAIKAVKKGEGANLKGNECYLRHCFAVAEEIDNTDEDAKLKEQIRETIVIVPDYFAPYETIVDFISEKEFGHNHQGVPRGGQVITRGQAGTSSHVVEFSLDLDRNPGFTTAIQVAHGCTVYRLKQVGESGTRTIFEIAPYLLSAEPLDDLVAQEL